MLFDPPHWVSERFDPAHGADSFLFIQPRDFVMNAVVELRADTESESKAEEAIRSFLDATSEEQEAYGLYPVGFTVGSAGVTDIQTSLPQSEEQREYQRNRLDRLTAGDILDGKAIVRITHIPKDGAQAPGAIVTRVWRVTARGETEYVTHFLNKTTGGCGNGAYTRDLGAAAENHAKRVNQVSPVTA